MRSFLKLSISILALSIAFCSLALSNKEDFLFATDKGQLDKVLYFIHKGVGLKHTKQL